MGALRIGIVGTGFARTRCAMVAALAETELAGVCGRDAARTAAVAEQYGVAASTDYRSFVARPDLDAVGVYASTDLHTEIGLAAAAAGQHVIVSKPTAVEPARAEQLLKACQAAGVRLVVEFDTRYQPGPYQVYRGIVDGRFGPVIQGEYANKCHRPQSYYDGAGRWRAIASEGGGCVLNQGVHAVDHLLWYQGRPEGAFAASGTFAHDMPAEDAASAVLRFPGGTLATFTATTTFRSGLPDGSYGGGTLKRAQVHGPDGSATVEGTAIQEWVSTTAEPAVSALPGTPPANVFQDFAWALADPGRPEHTLVADERALDSVYVCAAIRESAATGEYVRIDELRARYG
jgi:UDP-N-acetyl-2-amino-2-deoxyglucuronate dehydrogenase